MHVFPVPLVHQWADPPGPRACLGNQGVDEVVSHPLHDVNALHCDADLPGVRERSLRGLFGCPPGRHSGVDDQCVVAAVFQQGLGAAIRARPGNCPAGGTAADVSDHVDLLCGDQPGADRRISIDGLENTGGQVGRHQLGEPPAGARTTLAWLVHHGVSGHQRGTQ